MCRQSIRKAIFVALMFVIIGMVAKAAGSTEVATTFRVSASASEVGVQPGDWVMYNHTVRLFEFTDTIRSWRRLEFTNVKGTNVTVQITAPTTIGVGGLFTQTITGDIAMGIFPGVSAIFKALAIQPHRTIGDSVYVTDFDNVTITGETIMTYAKENRTVIYSIFSQSGIQLAYYWDKQTGIVLEASSSTLDGGSEGIIAVNTNIFQRDGLDVILYALIIAPILTAIALGLFIYRRKKAASEY